MPAQRSFAVKNGIVVARGYGIKIRVDRKHLVIADGVGRDRQTRRFHRATGNLRRLVLIGHTGYISLEAIRWLHDIGAALVHIDPDGRLLTTSTLHGRKLPALRRAQALAATSPAGVQVARELLDAKVTGQASLLPELPGGGHAQPDVSRALADIDSATTLRDLLDAEARAAAAYWTAWAALPVPIATRGRRQEHRIPEHWRAFGQRASLLTGGPRTATNPANAILNYLYALLEAETTVACQQIGLDPGLGLFHADQRDRDSLALDIMEAARPAVDAYLLGLLDMRTLAASDFGETPTGATRLTAAMASRLAETVPVWRDQVGPDVERVAHILGGSVTGVGTATPLTRANNFDAWDERAPRRRPPQTQMVALPHSCRDCGAQLPTRRHRYCEPCRRRRWEQNAHRGRQNAAHVLAGLRAEQRDPGHGGQAAERRGAKNAAHQVALKQWSGDRPDIAFFVADILPGLRSVPISRLSAVSGLSEHYCSLIRLGKRVPHPRHWELLQSVSDAGPSDTRRHRRSTNRDIRKN
jgi:CRISPR-associated protein Cas1